MNYYRCKCGKHEAWGWDSPPPCHGCPDCNTTLESHPDHHTEPQPHRWGEPEWEVDRKTGETWQVERCQNAYCRESHRVPPLATLRAHDLLDSGAGDRCADCGEVFHKDYLNMQNHCPYCARKLGEAHISNPDVTGEASRDEVDRHVARKAEREGSAAPAGRRSEGGE